MNSQAAIDLNISDAEGDADPVIEALKREVDHSLLIEMLKLTPEQRFDRMEKAIAFARECRAAAINAGQK